MQGIMEFTFDNVVGKKNEFKTKAEFLSACLNKDNGYNSTFKRKYGCIPHVDDVKEALVRYYPKGTEDSEMEFGKGEGVYQFVDKQSKGTFEVWCL